MTEIPFSQKLAQLDALTQEAWGDHSDRIAAWLDSLSHTDARPQPGDPAPAFVLPDAHGRLVQLKDLLKGKALVLSFIRGAWCPYCQAQTDGFQEAYPGYVEAGLTLAIVTPEVGGRAADMVSTFGLDMTVLCDVDQGVALSYGCVFPAPGDYKKDMIAAGFDLSELYGNKAWFIPLPATFLIAPTGRILHVFGGTDHRQRPDPKEVLIRSVHMLYGPSGQSAKVDG